MLLARIITALILIPLTLAILYFSSGLTFLFITGFIVLYGAWEWAGLLNLKHPLAKLAYVFLIFGCLLLAFIADAVAILKVATGWWLFVFVLLITYAKFNLWARSRILRGMMGILVLVPCWSAINFIRLRPNGFYILLFLLILIWGADTAAFFIGRKWGRHKLAPVISPGKTWEGFAAALVSSIPITLVICLIYQTPIETLPAAFVLGLITVFFSIIGDLFESLIKRQAEVKDSGNLLPGHGGLLDRIDSLTAAAPVFAYTAALLASYL